MSETYTDRSEERTMWQPRPNDPNLEAAFLARFMQYLGADEKQIQSELGDTAAAKQASNLAKLENGSLLLSGDYSRNWRRTALALDRIGLTVIGQNTEKHAFLVQPAQAEGAAVREKTRRPTVRQKSRRTDPAARISRIPRTGQRRRKTAHPQQGRQPLHRPGKQRMAEPPAYRAALRKAKNHRIQA